MTEPRAVTDQELIYFRSEKQRSILHLIFPFAETVYTAQVNQAFNPATNGVYDMKTYIDYDGGDGELTDVKPDMTMLVGTSEGGYELGICRIRKTPTASRFYIGEESEIRWQNDAYLTILNDFSIWPKHIKISGGNFLIDADIDYNNQLTNYDPIPIMGSDAVLELTGDAVNFAPAPAASTVLGSTISTYSWTATGGINPSGMDTQTPNWDYDAPGTYRYDLTVTAFNGKSFTGYRFVHVYDDDNPPTDDFVLSNFSGSFTDGDWSFDVEMVDNATRSVIRDRSKVILFSEDWYGSTKISIGQQAGRENVKCIGWIAEETIIQNPEQGTVSFSVRGPAYWLKRISGFPVGIEQCVKTAADWTESKSLTVNKAIFFLLHWRSTLTRVCDVTLSDSALFAKEFYTTAIDLWTQINEIAQNSIMASPAFDRYGRFFLSVEPQVVPTASRTWTNIMTLTKEDWIAPLDFVRKIVIETSMIILSGMKVTANNEASAYFSLANGHVYKHYGKPETLEKLLIGSQSEANVLAGNIIAWRNNEFPEIPIPLSAANFMFDMGPRMYASIAISPADNERGVEYSGNLIPRSISIEYNHETGAFLPTVIFEAEITTDINMNGDVPDTDAWDTTVPAYPEMDNFELPDIPMPVFYPPDLQTGIQPKKVVIGSNFGVLYTEDFDVDEPTWNYNNQGLSDYQKANITKLLVTPAGSMYIFIYDSIQANNFIIAASSLSGVWAVILEPTDYPPVLFQGQYYTDWAHILGMGIDPNNNDRIMIYGGPTWSPGVPTYGLAYFTFANGDGVETPILTDDGAGGSVHPHCYPAVPAKTSEGWTVLYANISGLVGIIPNPYIMRFTDDGAVISGMDSDMDLEVMGFGLGSSDTVWGWPAISGIERYVGLTATVYSSLSPTSVQGMALSPDGIYGMGSDDGKGNIPYITEDGGAHWKEANWFCVEDQCLPTGIDVYENCKDDHRFIVGGGDEIWFTPDRGVTFINKLGNLLDIAPGIDIQHIRYLS